MATAIDKKPVGDYYTWTQVRDWGWKWNDPNAVVKTWITFIQLNWSADITEPAISISDSFFNNTFKSVSEMATVTSDGTSLSVQKNISRFLNIAEEHQIVEFFKSLSESAVVSETSAINVGKFIYQSFNLLENVKLEVSKKVAEAISLTEDYSTLVEFIRKYDETISFAETVPKSIGANKSETLSLSDDSKKDVTQRISQSIDFEEIQTREWLINVIWTEYFSVFDTFSFDMTIAKSETFSILSGYGIDYHKPISESLQVIEDVSTIINFYRDIQEGISFDTAVSNSVTKSLEDKFSILEEFIKGGGEAIISDLRVLSKALTDSEFEELISQNSPTGYGPFIPFIAGDYEYQDALYKVVMTSRNASRPYVNQIRYEVDLPDVFDKGTQTIPAARTQINFSKTFHNIPDVSVVVRRGSLNYVPLVDVDVDPNGRFFNVELTQPLGAPSPGTPVGGEISWKAQGY